MHFRSEANVLAQQTQAVLHTFQYKPQRYSLDSDNETGRLQEPSGPRHDKARSTATLRTCAAVSVTPGIWCCFLGDLDNKFNFLNNSILELQRVASGTNNLKEENAVDSEL